MPALPPKPKSPSPSSPSTPSPLSNTSQAAPRLGKTKIKASSLDYDIFLKHHNPSKVPSLSSTTTASINLSATSPTSTTAITNLSKLSGNVLSKKFQKQSNLSQHYQQYPPQQLASEWKLQHQTSLPHATSSKTINASSTTIPTTAACNKFTTATINQITHASSTTSLASSTITTGRYQEFKMEIINQGKCLCGQYIRARLRRAGYLNRKAIQRLRTILEPSSDVVFEVFPALNTMGEELERMHPRVYTNISRQLSRAPFGELEDSDTAPVLLNLVAKDLFRSSITWGKIISIFAVCGGFAIDCVRQGHYDYLQYLVDGIAEIIEDDLVHWLIDNGGWLGLQQHIRPQNGKITFLGWLTLFVVMSSSFYVVMKFAKHVGCHLYTFLLKKG